MLYTDGIPEARRPDPNSDHSELFGEGRLRESVRSRSRGTSQEIVEGVLEDLACFLGDSTPDDDRTLVVLTEAAE